MKALTIVLATAIATTTYSPVSTSAAERSLDELDRTVRALDSAVFDAFNRCTDPEQLAVHASYFAEDVEFYHADGGVTWTRDEMLDRTRDNACGKYRRELVADTMEVFPIRRFGAIAQGTHRFCEYESTMCGGIADFVMIWREYDGVWRLTRVMSYRHRAAEGMTDGHERSDTPNVGVKSD